MILACNRCGKPTPSPEVCFWCLGDLCGACWDELGHCGHPEAVAFNRATRTMSYDERCKMALALVPDDEREEL